MKRLIIAALITISSSYSFAGVGVQNPLEDMPLRTGIEPKVWSCDVGFLAVDSNGKYVCVDCPAGVYNPKTGYCEGTAYSIEGCSHGTYVNGQCISNPKIRYEYKCDEGKLQGDKCVVFPKNNKSTHKPIYVFGYISPPHLCNSGGICMENDWYEIRIDRGIIKKYHAYKHDYEYKSEFGWAKTTYTKCDDFYGNIISKSIDEINIKYSNGSLKGQCGREKNGNFIASIDNNELKVSVKYIAYTADFEKRPYKSVRQIVLPLDKRKVIYIDASWRLYGLPHKIIKLESDGKGKIRSIIFDGSIFYGIEKIENIVYDSGWQDIKASKVSTSCPIGFVLNGDICEKPAKKVKKLTCEFGTLKDGKCVSPYITKQIICPAGWTVKGKKCITTPTVHPAVLK